MSISTSSFCVSASTSTLHTKTPLNVSCKALKEFDVVSDPSTILQSYQDLEKVLYLMRVDAPSIRSPLSVLSTHCSRSFRHPNDRHSRTRQALHHPRRNPLKQANLLTLRQTKTKPKRTQ
ncbi:hypothetical protein PRIC1_011496 [Phytophthora ramorum]